MYAHCPVHWWRALYCVGVCHVQLLGLEVCRKTRIGNHMVKGISGGQAKRTNIGIALVTSPRWGWRLYVCVVNARVCWNEVQTGQDGAGGPPPCNTRLHASKAAL